MPLLELTALTSDDEQASMIATRAWEESQGEKEKEG